MYVFTYLGIRIYNYYDSTPLYHIFGVDARNRWSWGKVHEERGDLVFAFYGGKERKRA